jgi:hypothetical protein
MESQSDRPHSHLRQAERVNTEKERRAKSARRSSRFIYPKTAAREFHQSRSAFKNQNPQNGHLMARFDWGLGAFCFGANPVAAVFGSAPGSATPPEHRIQSNPTPQFRLLKEDISIWKRIGHFYLALTREMIGHSGSPLECGLVERRVPTSCRGTEGPSESAPALASSF